jgi:predicted acyl esterase
MEGQKPEIIFREGVPPAKGGYTGFKPRREKAEGMVIDYDISVPMRDGKKIDVDLYRPEKEGKYPLILAWTPYGKHGRVKNGGLVNSGLDERAFNKYTSFEGPDAVYWSKNGYAVMVADMRGAWHSEGDVSPMSPQEAEDCYDLIEWSAAQEWCSGKVGMLGVSYLAWTQWKVAALNPPHLAAICPWEGVSDFYRELAFHGGIPETWFYPGFQNAVSFSQNRAEDLIEMQKQHPFYDEYWQSKNADLSKIKVPALVVASWTDHGLHNRGTLEGFRRIASKDKFLIVHGRKKWQHFYLPESVEKQRQFFNRFLRDMDNRVKYWPRVTVEVREKYFVGASRSENEWPIARTDYQRLYINVATRGMKKTPYATAARTKYQCQAVGTASQNMQTEYLFGQDSEITGYMKLRLWVEAAGSDDMDLFVAIDKIDAAGYCVPFPWFGNHDDGPVAQGWLRVSHRELDEAKSTPFQPFHKHQNELKLKPGERVPVEIEIWASSTLFEAGEKLRLTVQGSDIYFHPEGGHSVRHVSQVNRGEHILWSGGEYDSYLLIPLIPALR